MKIFLSIIFVIIVILITLDVSGIFRTPNKEAYYSDIENENIPNPNKTNRQKNLAKILKNQKTIINLTALNTILITVLIGILIFVIVKIYPYLDTLKEYYQLLDNLKDLLNYPINGSYY